MRRDPVRALHPGWALLALTWLALMPAHASAAPCTHEIIPDAELFDLRIALARSEEKTINDLQKAREYFLKGEKSFNRNRYGKDMAGKWFLMSVACSPSVAGYVWVGESTLFISRSLISTTVCVDHKMLRGGRAASAYRLALGLASAINEPFPKDHPEQQIRDRLMCMEAYAHRKDHLPPKACELFYSKVAASC